MEKQVKQRLEKAGINVDSALARFMGNEGLFLKFLEKFLQDRSFEGLLEAVKNEDARQAFQYAHTLKGVCGNLSMDELYGLISRQTEFFREGNFQKGADMLKQISAVYYKIKEAIEKEKKGDE